MLIKKIITHVGKQRHVLLWLVAVLYLLASPAIYYRFLIREGKPVEIWKTPPQEAGEIQYHIEGMSYWSKNMVVHDEGQTYAVGGWAFLNRGPNTQQADFDRFIIVYDESSAYIFPVQIYSRPDLEGAFKDIGLSNLTSSGFNAVISRNALGVGDYGIGLLFKHKQDKSSYYIQTNRVLVRTSNHLLLRPISK